MTRILGEDKIIKVINSWSLSYQGEMGYTFYLDLCPGITFYSMASKWGQWKSDIVT